MYPKTPHAGIANAARGDDQRRTRGLQTPHAGIANAARGDLSLLVGMCQIISSECR